MPRRLLLPLGIALALAGLGGGGLALVAQGRNERQWRRELILNARSALDRRDLAGASALVQVGLARKPGDPDLLLMRGDIARDASDYNSARTAYLSAASDRSTASEARARLFDMAAAIGAAEDAAHHLDVLEKLLGPADPRVKQRREHLKIAAAVHELQ